MALIKHANAELLAREAIVLDLGDLTRQGQALIESARARADQILAEARAERDRLVAGAAERGRAEGLAKGLDEGRAKGREEGRAAALAEHRDELARLAASWQAALDEFAAQRQVLLNHAHADILKLAVLIAERVVKRAIELDPGAVVDQVRAVLAAVTRPTELLLRVHPEDLETARSAMPGLLAAFELVRGAEVVGDPALARGSCVASARAGPGGIGGGEIDASIGGQLERIVGALLPGGDGRHPARTEPEP